MNSNVLNGVRLLVWGDNEAIRSELYATLSIEGWQADAVFPDDAAEFEIEAAKVVPGTLVVVAETDGIKAQKILGDLFKIGFEPSQIILGCPKKSFNHRLLVRHKVEIFNFEFSRTPTGPKVEVGEVVVCVLRAWKAVCGFLLDKEVNEAVTSGFLVCLKALAGLNSTGPIKERAHLAHAMAQHISNDYGFQQRVIRYALSSELSHLDCRSELISERRSLWVIKDLLESTSRLEAVTETWSDHLPLEVLVVKSVQMFQVHQTRAQTTTMIERIERLTQNLNLEKRMSLKNSFSATLGRIRLQERTLHAI